MSASPATDPTEERLGIKTYLCPDVPGFSAVLKARYSDFIVHEVACDGTIARLTCMEPRLVTDPPPTVQEQPSEEDAQEAERKRKREEEERKQLSPSDWEKLRDGLAGLVGKDPATETITFLQRIEESRNKKQPSDPMEPNNVQDEQYNVSLPPVADKEIRRNLHQWVRENLSGIARSDTVDDDKSQTEKVIRIWHESFTRKMPNWKAFEKEKNNRNTKPAVSKPPPGKKFLRFVLYKENMDTSHAINQISRGCGRKLRTGYAGMKDKRGITSQFVTVPASTPIQSLGRWNTSQNSRGGGHTQNKGTGVLRVGSFEYVEEDLRMGRLAGNRFDIALRNIQRDGMPSEIIKSHLEQAAQSLKQHGFINYFGVQRFGKFHDTHLVGIEVLKGNYMEAIDIIMEPKPSEREEMTAARQEWRNRFQNVDHDRETAEKVCAEKFIKVLSRNLNNTEMSVLQSLVRFPLDYKRAYKCIQKTMRMMFVHAVQSYLWNHASSFRIDTLGRNVVKGDLVASSSGDKFGVHVVSDDDLSKNIYALKDVLIPMIGTRTQTPENEVGAMFDSLLKDLKLSREVFDGLEERDFDLCGDYRNLVCPSAELDFKIIEYVDPLQPLIQTDLMKLHGIEIKEAVGDDRDNVLLAMDVAFTLPSSTYATVALRELMKRPTSSEYQSELKLG